jgi:Tfp pilus assembly protein PilN
MLACSVAGALLCFASLRETTAQNEIAKLQIAQMDEEAKRLKGEGEKVQQQLSPEQRTLLVAAHKLVANKAFGWSRLFADLEQVLPGSVSASRISVANIYKENERIKAELEFSVLSRDYQSVMTMIENMNSSGVFQAELRGQDLQKSERFTFTEYTLRLIYTPGYGYSTAPTTDIAQTGGNQ